MKAFLTCEHAGYEIADWLKGHIHIPQEVLYSHRGWDPGAYKVAESLKRKLKIPLWSVHTSRLIVEPNRSLDHPQFFSSYSRNISSELKARMINYIYHPFRNAVREWIQRSKEAETIYHLSIHSFTQVLEGKERNADIGLLYDPSSELERFFCDRLYFELKQKGWRVRKNYPYQGRSDGHTTALRKQWMGRYCGVEIELNQALLMRPKLASSKLTKDLKDALQSALEYERRYRP